MQASSCNTTQFNMLPKQIISNCNRIIGTNVNASEKPIESYQRYLDSEKRRKIDTTDWTNRPVGEQRGNLSDNCVFTWAGHNRFIPELCGFDQLSPKRASNHRYGPDLIFVANRRHRQHLVPGRSVGAYHLAADSISCSG